MNRAFATLIFGLAASLCWGSGDFSGGLAARRTNAASVVVGADTVGIVLLVVLALIWHESFPTLTDLFWGGLAGLISTAALVFFYTALSIGRMGIVASVSAMLTAALPVFFSIFSVGLPSLLQIVGFILALFAIVLISRPERAKGYPKGFGLALLSGCGFGCFFILISRVSPTETFWPLVIARLVAVFFLVIITLLRRQPPLPSRSVAPLIVIAGILDAFGNTFFVLAAHTGRLDVATILSSLYPAATVLLATFVLREKMTRIQSMGMLLALIAVPLISL